MIRIPDPIRLDATPPTVPQDLAASPVGTERIDLSWTASEDPESGIEGYRVFRDGILVARTGSAGFTDNGLAPATNYCYRVSAVDTAGIPIRSTHA